ncbi:ATP-binding protein [Kineococcus sp. NUM-3379]
MDDDGPRGSGPPVRVDLDADLSAARTARGVLRRWCEHLRLPPDTRDVVLLVGSELVTNAVVHGSGPVLLRIGADAGALLLEVGDSSPAAPRARAAGPGAVDGRGIHLLALLSSAWGVRPDAPGKTVWCRIPFATPPLAP